MRSMLTVAAMAMATLVASPALAQPEEYLSLSAAGAAASSAGRHEEAYALFEQAHAVFPNARSFRAMGASAFQLGRYTVAVRHYEAALSDERRPLTPELRAQAQEELDVARRLVGSVRVTLSTPGAAATIDGDDVTLGTSLLLDPGPHELVVRAGGYVEQRRSFTTRAGEEHPFEISLDHGEHAADVAVASPAPRRTVRVHVEATSDDIALQQEDPSAGAADYVPVCVAPCDVELEPGTYTFGVSSGQHPARRAEHDVFRFEHDTSLVLEYESREDFQNVGVVVGTVGVIGGALTIFGALLPPRAFEEDDLIALVVGSTILGIALIVSIPLCLFNDHADVRVAN